MEFQGAMKSQKNIKKEEQSWKPYFASFQNSLQINSNQDSVGLPKRQIYKPKQQNSEPRNERLHLWPNDFQQGCQRCRMGNSLFHK